MIFPTLTVEENIETGLENSKTRQIPEDIYALFPVLWDARFGAYGPTQSGINRNVGVVARPFRRS